MYSIISRIKKSLLLVTIVITTFFSHAVFADNIKHPSLVFIVPAKETDEFFKPLVEIMQIAAMSLQISIEVLYTDRSPVALREKGNEILNRKEKPDYFILINDRDVAPKLMQKADTKGITTVLFNGSLSEERHKAFRQGENALKHWIGGIFPDEEQAGYLLAKTLVEKAREKSLYDTSGATPKIKIIGLNGARRSFTTVQRGRGLLRYVSEHKDVELTRSVHAYWKKGRAETAVKFLLKSYPNSTVIWSASDLMALGAVQAIEKNQKKAGKDILTCGVDWILEIFKDVENGTVSCSVGGHVFDGAWLMVLLLDHFNGLTDNFLDEKTQFSVVDKQNLQKAKQLMNKDLWNSIDFRQFSKTYGNQHPKNFSADLLLQSNKR